MLGLWPIFAAVFVLTLGEGSFALLIAPYLDTRGLDPGLIGGLVAVYGVASLVTRAGAGSVYTSRRGPSLAAGATLASAAAFWLIPTTGSAVPIALLIGLNGAGFAFGTTVLMAAVMERRPPPVPAGTLMGVYTGSLGAGYAISGFVGGTLAEALGVGTAFRVVAGVAAVAAAAIYVALHYTAVSEAAPPAPGGRARVAAFRRVPRWVWLGFAVTLYINLVSGVLFTFFPLHGLDIGLTLGQIGFVFGLHGVLAALVRFGSARAFATLPYRAAMTPAVLLSAVSLGLLGRLSSLLLIAVAWSALGLARGLLRVSSAALVLDESRQTDAGRGAASSVYLSGLDVGKILGPALGGVGAEAVGIPATFAAAAVAFPLVYLLFRAGVAQRFTEEHQQKV